MVFEHQRYYPSQWVAIGDIKKLGMQNETQRVLVRRAQVDRRRRASVTTEERERIDRLEWGEPRAAPGERDGVSSGGQTVRQFSDREATHRRKPEAATGAAEQISVVIRPAPRFTSESAKMLNHSSMGSDPTDDDHPQPPPDVNRRP